ncbi:FtsW/RodA/SpoVE family cell cycle protein [Lachnospiraceae bacterium]|nr:FtsW/RodA/SpoVE family cell cycle protein [Lachnospiraceae bacterium]
MELYITEISKYVITLLMALYAYESFAVFRFREEERRGGIYTRQNLLMLAVHFSCFMAICFETGDISYLFFYVFQQIVLFATAVLFHMVYPEANRLIINNMCMLLSIGFVILTRLSYEKAVKQFVIVAVSIAVAMVIPFFIHKLKFLKRLKWVYALAGIGALAVVLILGAYTYGSKISYSIGGVTFQPSEFVKIIFVFFVASALHESTSFLEVFTTAVIAGVHVIILVVSKDLGSALIFFVVYVLMVFVATKNPLYLLAGAAGGSGAAVIAYQAFSHVQVRVQAWKDPWSEIDSAGYQITQSLFAIGSGGWFGMGLFEGTPESIPFVEADFIFSAVAEELGILFAMCMILVCISCFVMFMDISMRLHDRFYRLIAFGLGVTYIFQVFLTIGGGSKFIPLTGVTLPLISYGGSSVLTTLIMFAIIEGLCIVKEEEEQEELVPPRKQKGSKRIGAEDALTGKKGKRKRNRSQSNRKNEEADEVIN